MTMAKILAFLKFADAKESVVVSQTQRDPTRMPCPLNSPIVTSTTYL